MTHESNTLNIGEEFKSADYPVWIWDHDRMRIIWANQKGLEFWNEQTILDLCERDFPPSSNLVQNMQTCFLSLKDKHITRNRLTVYPAGVPIKIECVLLEHYFPEGRIGVRVEVHKIIQGSNFEIERFREVIALAPFPISLFSEDGVLLLQNKADEIAFGAGQQAGLISRYIDKEQARNSLRSVLMNGSHSHAHELNTKHGYRKHRISFRRMHDPVTGSATALAFMVDISDRYQNLDLEEDEEPEEENIPTENLENELSEEDALTIDETMKRKIRDFFSNKDGADDNKESESYNPIIDEIPIGVMIINDNLIVDYINETLKDLLDIDDHIDPDETSLRSCFPNDYEYLETSICQIFGSHPAGSISEIDTLIKVQSENPKWLFCSLKNIARKDGNQICMCFTDISREKKSIDELKEEEKSKMDAISQFGVYSFFISLDGRIIKAPHKALTEVFGAKESSAKQTNIISMLTTESRKAFIQYLADVQENSIVKYDSDSQSPQPLMLTTTSNYRVELVGVGKSGEDSGFCIAVRKLDGAQAEKGTVDSSANTKEGSLKSKAETSENIMQHEKMLANVAHELKTPLNAIMGFAEIIKSDTDALSNPRYREYIEDIFECAQQMQGTLSNMLDIQKFQSGQYKINPQPLNLGKVTSSVTRIVMPLAKKRKVVMNVTIDPDLPLVEGDEYTIKQAVINIITNAVKYVKEGGRVYVFVSYEDGYGVVIEVSDNGEGMTPEELEMVQKPFQRLDHNSPEQEGSGLGVPLAKSMAKLNKVKFIMESEKGIGTIVRFVFGKDKILSKSSKSKKKQLF